MKESSNNQFRRLSSLEAKIDLFRSEAQERHTQIMNQVVQHLQQDYENCGRHVEQTCFHELAQPRAEADSRHEQMVSELTGFMMSRTVAEQEILNLRKERGEANARLKNAANSVALEAAQRANQKVSHMTSQYESRHSELKKPRG